MEILSKLDPIDIFAIAKLSGITKIYNKDIDQLLVEINKRKGIELANKVEQYFLKENVNRSLLNHNQKMKLYLNESKCYLKKIRFTNPIHTTPKDSIVIMDEKNAVKIFNARIPTYAAEYIAYTYVIPFLYYSNMTFNILVPNVTGRCKVRELVNDRTYGRHMNNQLLEDTMLYVNTPYVEKSLYEMSFNNDTDIYYYIFQMIYTAGAFGKIGMLQNDLHPNNVRVANMKRETPIKFVIDNNTSYNVNIKEVPLIYDFDFIGLDGLISKLLKKYRLPDKNKLSDGLCQGLSVCNDADEGRRDTLLFLFRFMMTYYGPINYINSNPRFSNSSVEYIRKIFKRSVNSQSRMKEVIKQIKEGELFAKMNKNYNDTLDLIINVTNGKVKKFFKSIQDGKYIPMNNLWSTHFRATERREPNIEEWVFDVIYRNKIPECPLPVPYNEEIMMSPVEILQSSYFKEWVSNSDKISPTLRPKFEVSINVDDDYITHEYDRFMKEMFTNT